MFHLKLAHNVEELLLEVVLKVLHHLGVKRRGCRRGMLVVWIVERGSVEVEVVMPVERMVEEDAREKQLGWQVVC